MNRTETKIDTKEARGPVFHLAFIDHIKCPPSFVEHIACNPGTGPKGFFRLGNMRLYGRTGTRQNCLSFTEDMPVMDDLVIVGNGSISLPFDPTEIICNLRLEKYVDAVSGKIDYIADNSSFQKRLYYLLRPLFPVRFRRILQRIALQNWKRIPFPNWPIDTSVEDFVNWLLVRILEASGEKEIPFIWYWPKEYLSCAIMTHDVETGEGQEFCKAMLQLEKKYGIRSSFELVPEVRYVVSEQIMNAIREAGGEVCVHGLNHDGRLFSSEEVFRNRAGIINTYAHKWGARGFRSPIMYRNQAWYDAFTFSYDMSIPNAAHLDPQRGGCCTIFPFFIGDILELPLTTIQDYALYNFLRCDPMEMWTKQTDAILSKHGLISFIIHPDYTIEQEKQAVYLRLLDLLKKRSEEKSVWLALPDHVNKWWRERAAMSLVRQGDKWLIHGKGSDRATLAYARLRDGQLFYVLPKGATELA